MSFAECCKAKCHYAKCRFIECCKKGVFTHNVNMLIVFMLSAVYQSVIILSVIRLIVVAPRVSLKRIFHPNSSGRSSNVVKGLKILERFFFPFLIHFQFLKLRIDGFGITFFVKLHHDTIQDDNRYP
jgi:hypothetical protein